MTQERSRVLVLVKATPQPSRQYGDTVCVAGVAMDDDPPRLVRLYPVPFRYMDGDKQFKKYDVIEVRTRDAGADKRPESRKIDVTSISVIQHVDAWRKRSGWIEPLVGPAMCDLVDGTRADINAPSLGVVRPSVVDGLRFEKHPGWKPDELARFEAYRRQGDLFQEMPPRLLDAPPLKVFLRYRCTREGCEGHDQRILDWEMTGLQARFRREPRTTLTAAITRNFLEIPFAADRAPLIFVGNQENVQRRSSFTVLGLYYPRRADIEPSGRLF